MSKMKLSTIAILGVVALATWALVGCGGSSSGTGQIQVSLVDMPLQSASAINVQITSVQVHKSGGGWITLKEYDPALPVNLLDYSSGESLMLADCPLEAGHYTMIRLMISSADIMEGDVLCPVDITNVEQTGVKCNGQFTVEEGQLMALVLDFNAMRSFIDTGGGNYMLHPVMTMSPVNIASEVIGKVEFQDQSQNVLPLPEGVVVHAYADGAAVGDPSIASAAVGADGTFRIAVLAQGTYDFKVVQEDSTLSTVTELKSVDDVLVAPPTTDLGTIVVVQEQGT